MKRTVAYVNEAIRSTTDPDLYAVALVTEDEAGYYESVYTARTIRDAQRIADSINFDVPADEVMDVVTSSFRASLKTRDNRVSMDDVEEIWPLAANPTTVVMFTNGDEVCSDIDCSKCENLRSNA